jgi:hypothetical protein
LTNVTQSRIGIKCHRLKVLAFTEALIPENSMNDEMEKLFHPLRANAALQFAPIVTRMMTKRYLCPVHEVI